MGEMELSFSEFVLKRIDILGYCCTVCCGFRVRLLVFEGFVRRNCSLLCLVMEKVKARIREKKVGCFAFCCN